MDRLKFYNEMLRDAEAKGDTVYAESLRKSIAELS